MAELAYALDSKSSGREVMRVRLPPSAPIPHHQLDNARIVLRSGLEAVPFDRFEPQSGGDGNTYANTRRNFAEVVRWGIEVSRTGRSTAPTHGEGRAGTESARFDGRVNWSGADTSGY